MFIVTKTHNFDQETEAAVFAERDKAVSYLQWLWEDYYNEEIADGSKLDESECYHEEDFAKIEWEDGCQTWFNLIETSPSCLGEESKWIKETKETWIGVDFDKTPVEPKRYTVRICPVCKASFGEMASKWMGCPMCLTRLED